MQNNNNNMVDGRIMGIYFSLLNFPKICNVLILLSLGKQLYMKKGNSS